MSEIEMTELKEILDLGAKVELAHDAMMELVHECEDAEQALLFMKAQLEEARDRAKRSDEVFVVAIHGVCKKKSLTSS
jgi:hypothetical protein